MPIYEYECSRCGKIEEAFQKISDPPLSNCKACSGNLHKIVSQSSFHLKGSGWYVTDYASKTPTSSKSSEKTEKSESKTSDSSKSSEVKTT